MKPFKDTFTKQGEASDYPFLDINEYLLDCPDGLYNVSITRDKTNLQCRLIHACIREYKELAKEHIGEVWPDPVAKLEFKKAFKMGYLHTGKTKNGEEYTDFIPLSIADYKINEARELIEYIKYTWYHRFGYNCESIAKAEKNKQY